MRIAITGASGLVGTALSATLSGRGDEVVHVVRRAPRTTGEIRWEPGADLPPSALDGLDAVVHLAGAGVADKRWTDRYREVIRSSRVDGTRTLARALADRDGRVRVVSGSAVGVYGSDRGDEILTEASPSGAGFLADVVRDWEAEMTPAKEAGHPVAFARTGIVLSADGGAMGRVLPLAKLGLGGPLGDGHQYWPVVTLEDEVRALIWLLDHPDIVGPVNIAIPEPIRQGDFMRELGRLLRRPAIVPAPSVALKAALGGFADDILGSQRVTPRALLDSGFAFSHPDGPTAAAWLAEQA